MKSALCSIYIRPEDKPRIEAIVAALEASASVKYGRVQVSPADAVAYMLDRYAADALMQVVAAGGTGDET